MNKTLLFIATFSLFTFFVNTSFAQSNVTQKAGEVTSLLNNSLSLTPAQQPGVSSLVNEFAGKYASASNSVAPAAVKSQTKSTLMNEFSSGLTKILSGTQASSFTGIKDKVSGIFNSIK